MAPPARLRSPPCARMLLFPGFIFQPFGGEGTFVRVGVKTEFIAPAASGQDKGDMGEAHAPRGDVCCGEETGRSSP